jgi:Tol biopolymer transport system component
MKNQATEGVRMRRPTIGILIGVVALAGVLLGSTRTEALHLKSPLLTQVTDRPSQILDGAHFTQVSNVMMFHSDADLLGNGNTVPQIFVFDTAKRILKHIRAFYQVTNGDQASLHPSGSPRASTFAYYTAGDPLGNGSTGRQVFTARQVHFKHPDKIKFVQLTKGVGESYDPVVNFSGRFIVFSSTGDLNKENLAPGQHLYRAEPRKLRNAKCGSYPCPFGGDNPGLLLVAPVIADTDPAVSPGGDQVAFVSTEDAAQNGCVNGAKQIFLRDFKTNTIQQLTFGAADSTDPTFSRDGEFIFFESAADLALNGNTRTNIFMLDLGQVPFKLTQVTFGTDGDTTDPAPGPGGATRLYFTSTADLKGTGVTGVKRLYVMEFHQGNKIYRLSDNQDIDPGIDGNFSFVIFVSDSDWLGNGNNQKALFFLNSFRIVGEPPGATPGPTPGPTPHPGDPATIGLALTTNLSEDNGDGTLTTVIAATVADTFGAPVADGIRIDFSVLAPTNGAVISDADTNGGPTPECNLIQFQARTGVPIINQPGKAYGCLTYPREQVNTIRQIKGTVSSQCVGGVNDGQNCSGASACPGGACQQGSATATNFFTLPAPIQDCNANGLPCNDFNPCTLNDVCGGGTNTCIGGSNAGLACTTNAQCVTPTGGYCQLPTCQPGAPKTCADDGNLCTDDTCNFFTGQCYTPKQCFDDGNVCTDDVCDPATGLCGIPNTAPCTDDNPCTLNDACAASACVPGPLLTCPDDGNPCTIDQCNPDTGNCGIPGVCACP